MTAGWAWLALTILIVAYVVAFDVWAAVTHHLTMTGQFRDWLTETVAGPIIMGVWVGIFVGLTYHFLVRAKR